MEAVLTLLSTSADQSAFIAQMGQQDNKEAEAIGEEDEEIEHNGKKYQRVVIEGLGDQSEYLIDEQGDIFTLNFQFVTNMSAHEIVENWADKWRDSSLAKVNLHAIK